MKKSVCLLLSLFCSALLFAEKPIVQDIQAKAGSGSKINVTWTLPQNPDSAISVLYVYRSDKQINSYSQIETMTPIAVLDAEASSYTDNVPDFKDYYYAVIAIADSPYRVILRSFNATISGTHVKTKTKQAAKKKVEEEKLYPEGTLRETPLPYIDYSDGIGKKEAASEIVATKTRTLIAETEVYDTNLTQYIFEEDMISPDGGDDYLLFEILKTSFVTRKYSDAIASLNKLIGTNISDETRNRAYFYLGESQYLSGDYEAAVKTFVKIEQIYPTISKKWLNAALDRI